MRLYQLVSCLEIIIKDLMTNEELKTENNISGMHVKKDQFYGKIRKQANKLN